MKFKTEFEMDNAWFEEDPEARVATLLRSIGKRVCDGQVEGTVLDGNGNSIGSFEIVFVD